MSPKLIPVSQEAIKGCDLAQSIKLAFKLILLNSIKSIKNNRIKYFNKSSIRDKKFYFS